MYIIQTESLFYTTVTSTGLIPSSPVTLDVTTIKRGFALNTGSIQVQCVTSGSYLTIKYKRSSDDNWNQGGAASSWFVLL